jgi:hypothetical protein
MLTASADGQSSVISQDNLRMKNDNCSRQEIHAQSAKTTPKAASVSVFGCREAWTGRRWGRGARMADDADAAVEG